MHFSRVVEMPTQLRIGMRSYFGRIDIHPTIIQAMQPESAAREARIALWQLDCWAKINGAGVMQIVMKYMWDILMEILTDLICAGPEHMIWRQFFVFNDQTFGPGRARFSVIPGFPNVQGSNDVDWYGDRNERNDSSKREDQTGYSIPPYRKWSSSNISMVLEM